MVIRGVLFDFGLTLAYPPSFKEAIAVAGHALGRSEDEITDFIRAICSVESHPDVQAAEARRDYSSDEHRAADMSYVIACNGDQELMAAFYDLCVSPTFYSLYPDTLEALDALRDHDVRLGLLSNCGWDLRRNLEVLGIAEYFFAVTVSSEHNKVKPDVDLFALACARLDLPPEAVLMVGDSASADAGAVRAGMPTLLLPATSADEQRGLRLVVSAATS